MPGGGPGQSPRDGDPRSLFEVLEGLEGGNADELHLVLSRGQEKPRDARGSIEPARETWALNLRQNKSTYCSAIPTNNNQRTALSLAGYRLWRVSSPAPVPSTLFAAPMRRSALKCPGSLPQVPGIPDQPDTVLIRASVLKHHHCKDEMPSFFHQLTKPFPMLSGD